MSGGVPKRQISHDATEELIKQASLAKLQLEIVDLKRWWAKMLPVFALIATLAGLVTQQFNESNRREDARYQQALSSLANPTAAERVSGILALSQFAADSNRKSAEIAPVLINQLWSESIRPASQSDEAVLDALISTLGTLADKSVLNALIAQNRRATIYLSRATALYWRHTWDQKPERTPSQWANFYKDVGLTIALKDGLPFEANQKYRFVPVRLDALRDLQSEGNARLPGLAQRSLTENAGDRISDDYEHIREYVVVIWTNSLAITRWLQKHLAEGTATSFADIRLIAPDFTGLDLHGSDFSHSALIQPVLEKTNLSHCNFERAVIWRAKTDAETDMTSTVLRELSLDGMNPKEDMDYDPENEVKIWRRVNFRDTDLNTVSKDFRDIFEKVQNNGDRR